MSVKFMTESSAFCNGFDKLGHGNDMQSLLNKSHDCRSFCCGIYGVPDVIEMGNVYLGFLFSSFVKINSD